MKLSKKSQKLKISGKLETQSQTGLENFGFQKKICIVGLMLLTVVIVACGPPGPGEYDTFAQCLTEKGATMYGTEWCSHCKNQKEEFGNSFQHVTFIDCDDNKAACNNAGVRGYPTWIINGVTESGVQSLNKLAALSECELVKDEIVT